MNYLYSATKDWKNIEPLNYTYNDNGFKDGDYTYTSFVSTKGIATITSLDNVTITIIGTSDAPLRVRMPIYTRDTVTTEVSESNGNNEYLYENLTSTSYWAGSGTQPTNNISGISGYWTLTSVGSSPSVAMIVYYPGILFDDYAGSSSYYGVRPVITLKL